MIIPIRCFSCGKPIAHHWEEYKDRIKNGENQKEILDSFGMERFCCRTMFLGQVDLIDISAEFRKF
jgi:DNA-directed RNA polymerase subunit N